MFYGYIGVTEEIRSFQERNYYGKKIPSAVISNGVKKRIEFSNDLPLIDTNKAEIIFVFLQVVNIIGIILND